MSLFTDFASSTSNGRTGVLITACMICGVTTQRVVEVTDFNEYTFKKNGSTRDSYSSTEWMRHMSCIKSGKKDFDYLRDEAHEADLREEKRRQLADDCYDSDLDLDDLDLDSL